MFSNQLIAAIRTGAATLAGICFTYLLSLGIDVPEAYQTSIVLATVIILTGVYNVAVNWLAIHVHPLFGILLGIPKTPTYDATAVDAENSVIEGNVLWTNLGELTDDEVAEYADLGVAVSS